MPSLLEGQIANAIYAGFKGKLLKGSLTRNVPGGGLDELGDPISTTVQTFKFEGFTESFSAFYRSQSGIPDTDSAVLIFAKSIKTVPTKDDKVTLKGVTYQVRKLLEIDPAGATYRLQCFEV